MSSWKIADIGRFFGNIFKAIIKGELLLRLNVGRYFVHIIYTFFVFIMIIWIGLGIEKTLSQVEKNKATITELEIAHSQKVYELASASRRSTVEATLKELGSKVGEPTKPATELKGR